MKTYDYRNALVKELAQSRFLKYKDNFDRINVSRKTHVEQVLRETIEPDLFYVFNSKNAQDSIGRIISVARTIASFYLRPRTFFSVSYKAPVDVGEYLYSILGDEQSRKLLVKLIAYRLLGHQRVKLPSNTDEHWDGLKKISSLRMSSEFIPTDWNTVLLAQYDALTIGYNMKIFASSADLACLLLQKQYEYHRNGIVIKAEPGDVVIDVGACWGDTALYFAHEVGPVGRVISFEFNHHNIAVMRKNLDANPHLSPRVSVIENPVWRLSGCELFFVNDGPGSRVSDDEAKRSVWHGSLVSAAIDDVVRMQDIQRVDMIKMDVEGTEMFALKGAERTIQRFKPKLAISLYHNFDDINIIPRYISSLGVDYSFYLGHHSIFQNETMLYAVAK